MAEVRDEALLELGRINELKDVRKGLRTRNTIGQGDPFPQPIERALILTELLNGRKAVHTTEQTDDDH